MLNRLVELQYFISVKDGRDIAVLDSQYYAKFSKDGYKGVRSWHEEVIKHILVSQLGNSL